MAELDDELKAIPERAGMELGSRFAANTGGLLASTESTTGIRPISSIPKEKPGITLTPAQELAVPEEEPWRTRPPEVKPIAAGAPAPWRPKPAGYPTEPERRFGGGEGELGV